MQESAFPEKQRSSMEPGQPDQIFLFMFCLHLGSLMSFLSANLDLEHLNPPEIFYNIELQKRRYLNIYLFPPGQLIYSMQIYL